MPDSFTDIGDGIYLIQNGRSNVYLLVGDDLTLIDTGMPGDGEEILRTIDTIGREPSEISHILITHGHMDHIGSLALLKKASKATVIAGRKDIDYIEGKKKMWTMGRQGAGGKLFKIILFFMETFVFKYEQTEVDISCQGGEIIDCFGGMQAIATPGHSMGSLSFYQRDKGILFVGDAVSGAPELKLPPVAGCTDHKKALRSVGKLSELDFDKCFFGHGSPAEEKASEKLRGLLDQKS